MRDLSARRDPGNHLVVLFRTRENESLLYKRASRACLDAFAAPGAVFGLTPFIRHIADQPRRNAPSGYFPDVSTLQFRTSANAPRTENTPVVVNDISGMTHINVKTRIVIRISNVRDFERLSQPLQFAPPVRLADRADVVALDQKQFDCHPTIFFELGRRCPD